MGGEYSLAPSWPCGGHGDALEGTLKARNAVSAVLNCTLYRSTLLVQSTVECRVQDHPEVQSTIVKYFTGHYMIILKCRVQ